MMDWGVMFGDIVAFIVTAWCPIVSELFLVDSISKPVKSHVHGFEFFHDIVVDNAKGCCIVSLNGSRGLGMT